MALHVRDTKNTLLLPCIPPSQTGYGMFYAYGNMMVKEIPHCDFVFCPSNLLVLDGLFSFLRSCPHYPTGQSRAGQKSLFSLTFDLQRLYFESRLWAAFFGVNPARRENREIYHLMFALAFCFTVQLFSRLFGMGWQGDEGYIDDFLTFLLLCGMIPC